MFMRSLTHSHEEKNLLILGSCPNHKDIELTIREGHAVSVQITLRIDFRQLISSIGSVKTVDGTVSITSKRLQIVSDTGLGLSWLVTDWVDGENTMVDLIGWLRNTLEHLRSNYQEVPTM